MGGCVVDVEYASLCLSSASLMSAEDWGSGEMVSDGRGSVALADGGSGGWGERTRGVSGIGKAQDIAGC